MPSNIEFKASIPNLDDLESLVQSLSDAPREVLIQEDVFFKVPKGRLKLRIFPGNTAVLIFYERPDVEGIKQSTYSIYNTEDPAALRQVLETTLGAIITVKKVRHLYIKGQIRIHLDRVEELGTFAELEYVMEEGESPEAGFASVTSLMEKLGIMQDQLIDRAYADLLSDKNKQNPNKII